VHGAIAFAERTYLVRVSAAAAGTKRKQQRNEQNEA
jgi:hypothetical protein